MPTWRMTLVRPTRCTSSEVAGGAPPQVRADGLPTTRAAGPGPAAGADWIPDQHQLAVAGRTGPGRFLDAVERQARDPPDRRGTCPPGGTPLRASGTTARTPCRRPARATGVTVTTGDLGPGVTAGLLPGARPRTRRGLRSRLRAAPRPPAPSGSGGLHPGRVGHVDLGRQRRPGRAFWIGHGSHPWVGRQLSRGPGLPLLPATGSPGFPQADPVRRWDRLPSPQVMNVQARWSWSIRGQLAM